MAYLVTLRGGPANGLRDVVCNTRKIVFDGHRYVLDNEGNFVYSPAPEEVALISSCGALGESAERR